MWTDQDSDSRSSSPRTSLVSNVEVMSAKPTEFDYLTECILQESEIWMCWLREGKGMPSQVLWEALLVELCRLGKSSQAESFLRAGAEFGCTADWNRLAEHCGAGPGIHSFPAQSLPSFATVVKPGMQPLLHALPLTGGAKAEETHSKGKQVLELDMLLPHETTTSLRPSIHVTSDYADRLCLSESPIQGCRCFSFETCPLRAVGRLPLHASSSLHDQALLLQDVGRAGYIQKRIHRKLHDQMHGLCDCKLLKLGDLCFSKQFAEVERLRGRAST